MDRVQGMIWLRIVGILLAMLALMFIPFYFRRYAAYPVVARHVTELLPMIFVPPLAKLISDHDAKPIPMGRWLMAVGLMLVAEVAIDYREVWFPGRAYAQTGMFIFVLAMVFVGGFVIMRWGRER